MSAETARAIAEAAQAASHFVYVLEADEHFKVGFSRDPWERTRHIKKMVPFVRIELLTIIRGSEQTERDLHLLLRPATFKGEWFHKTELSEAVCATLRSFHIEKKPKTLPPASMATLKSQVEAFRKHELSMEALKRQPKRRRLTEPFGVTAKVARKPKITLPDGVIRFSEPFGCFKNVQVHSQKRVLAP